MGQKLSFISLVLWSGHFLARNGSKPTITPQKSDEVNKGNSKSQKFKKPEIQRARNSKSQRFKKPEILNSKLANGHYKFTMAHSHLKFPVAHGHFKFLVAHSLFKFSVADSRFKKMKFVILLKIHVHENW